MAKCAIQGIPQASEMAKAIYLLTIRVLARMTPCPSPEAVPWMSQVVSTHLAIRVEQADDEHILEVLVRMAPENSVIDIDSLVKRGGYMGRKKTNMFSCFFCKSDANCTKKYYAVKWLERIVNP